MYIFDFLIFKFFVWNFVLVCSMRSGTSFISYYAASQFSKHHLLKSHFSLTDLCCLPFSQLRCSVVSESLWPHGQQHAKLSCPSPAPGDYSNSCPLSWWCHPTISPSAVPLLLLPSILPSIRVFSSESALRIRWPKYWSCSFRISLSNGHPGLISFRMDWLDLLAVQGTLKSLL